MGIGHMAALIDWLALSWPACHDVQANWWETFHAALLPASWPAAVLWPRLKLVGSFLVGFFGAD